MLLLVLVLVLVPVGLSSWLWLRLAAVAAWNISWSSGSLESDSVRNATSCHFCRSESDVANGLTVAVAVAVVEVVLVVVVEEVPVVTGMESRAARRKSRAPVCFCFDMVVTKY